MKIRSFIISILLVSSSYNTASADSIIYNGITYPLYGYPLKIIPKFQHWKIKPIFGENADEKVTNIMDVDPYYCIWLVKDNHIYLQSINGKNSAADLKAVFPEKFDNGLVLADWIDTTLYAGIGNVLVWGFGTEKTYEYEFVFEVSKGEVLSVENCDNTKTRTLNDYGKFLSDQVDFLNEQIQSNINWDNLPKSDTINRRVYVQVISADSLGNIDGVRVLRGVNEIYDREAVRIVKTIPEWPVTYRHGKVVGGRVYPINFIMSDKSKK